MIYFIQQGTDGPIKIGYSTNPTSRMKALQSSNPHPLRLLGLMAGEPFNETKLHHKFEDLKIRGEWFYPSPELIEFIDDFSMKDLKVVYSQERKIKEIFSNLSDLDESLGYFPHDVEEIIFDAVQSLCDELSRDLEFFLDMWWDYEEWDSKTPTYDCLEGEKQLLRDIKEKEYLRRAKGSLQGLLDVDWRKVRDLLDEPEREKEIRRLLLKRLTKNFSKPLFISIKELIKDPLEMEVDCA